MVIFIGVDKVLGLRTALIQHYHLTLLPRFDEGCISMLYLSLGRAGERGLPYSMISHLFCYDVQKKRIL